VGEVGRKSLRSSRGRVLRKQGGIGPEGCVVKRVKRGEKTGR